MLGNVDPKTATASMELGHGLVFELLQMRSLQAQTDEWSCMCDDECPHCGARDMTPFKSEDLTELVEQDGNEFVAMRSSESTEHDPDYRELGRFPSLEKAEEFLASVDFS